MSRLRRTCFMCDTWVHAVECECIMYGWDLGSDRFLRFCSLDCVIAGIVAGGPWEKPGIVAYWYVLGVQGDVTYIDPKTPVTSANLIAAWKNCNNDLHPNWRI